MIDLARRLDRLHGRLRANPILYRFALSTRLLLAMGFIPTGMVKLLGLRFTRLGVDNPVGLLFETLYQGGGFYWRFLGAVQVCAGLLILVPATATLGAVIFFPFILNIFVITVSYDFKGTPLITGPMVLASLFLLCWDYDRLRGVLFSGRYGDGLTLPAPVGALGSRWEAAAYATGAASGLLVFAALRLPVPLALVSLCLAAGTWAAVVAAAGAWRSLRLPPGMALTDR